MIDGSKVEDKARISDEFCKYFSTVGETCANNIPNVSKPYTHYMQGDSNMNSMLCMFTNYRPISLLSIISKTFEKVMHQRLYSFLQQHDNNLDLGRNIQRSMQ